MKKDVASLVSQLGQSMIGSPHLAVMILDKNMTVVWHNRCFKEEFKQAGALVGKKCFEITAAGKPHSGCPLKKSRTTKKQIKGCYDFGDKLFFFVTIPLGNGYAAKVHTYLPKKS
jgi:hypothetical protein